VLVEEKLYDADFVSKWCYGFDELAESVKEYTPEHTSEITWIPADKIVAAARVLGKAKNATMQWGVAVDMTREAIPASQAIAACFQITGNVDIPGGIIAPPELLNYAGGWGRELLSDEQFDKRIGLDTYPLMRFGFQVCHPDMVTDTFNTDKPYKMHGAWLQQNNAISCMAARPMRLYEGMKRLDFIVCVDLFMTPTIVGLADVVLPAACYTERDGIRLGDGVQRGETINKVCQVGECKSDMEINLMIGKRLNPEAWPWDNVRDMYTDMLKATGMTFPELQEKGPAYLPFSYRRYETGKLRGDGQPGFNTPTGRIELWSTFYANAGLDPLPFFTEPEPGPGSTPDLMEEYPYVLTTGARQWWSFHSEHRQIPRLRAGHPEPRVYVHSKILEQTGLKDDQWVWVENPYGRAKLKIEQTDIYDPRVIACDHAWWKPESDPDNLFDVWDYNINNLNPGIPGKSGFGSNYKTTLVKIYPVEPGDEHNQPEGVGEGLEQLKKGYKIVDDSVARNQKK
jgi:anaerobic selenocysteine-containing dehydrogenase